VIPQAEKDLAAGRVDEAIASLERVVTEHPNDFDSRDLLGLAYYRRARQALDEDRDDDYERDLKWAMDQWIESLRLNPTSARPHTWMGIVAAYQGNLKSATTNFRNALRLDPRNASNYTNLAQVLIYRGEVARARRWLKKSRRFHPNPAVLDLDYAFAAWRQGDLVEAEDLFNSAYLYSPEEVNTWDEAPVREHIDTFEKFAEYCCSNPACGPYMEVQCKEMQLEVARRQVRAETVRKELLIEMERRRKLDEIYGDRKDLKIEVEPAK
jgi:cytochrome c-type biogenesis protein CcmH/NrfG